MVSKKTRLLRLQRLHPLWVRVSEKSFEVTFEVTEVKFKVTKEKTPPVGSVRGSLDRG